MKIWMDDEKPPPFHEKEEWIWVNNPEEAIDLLRNWDAIIEVIVMDHDLGHPTLTGYDVLRWIADNMPMLKVPRIKLNTFNPVGHQNMMNLLGQMEEKAISNGICPKCRVQMETVGTTQKSPDCNGWACPKCGKICPEIVSSKI